MAKILPVYQQTYLSKFRKSQDSLITGMEEFAKANKVPILNWHAAEFLEQLILLHKPLKVLEIGMAIAYSTIRIARALPETGVIHTIEKSRNNIKIAKNYIRESGVAHKIKIIDGNACVIVPKLRIKYDFIFLDADKEDYENLFSSSLKLLSEKGVIVIDNLLWQGFAGAKNVPAKLERSTKHIREFNKLLMSTDDLISTILPVGDGLGIGVREGRN